MQQSSHIRNRRDDHLQIRGDRFKTRSKMDTNHSSYLIANTDNNYQEDEYYQEVDEEAKHEEQPFTNRDRINKIRLR